MKISVIIASVGRPDELARWPAHMARQTVQPVDLVLSIADASNLPADFDRSTARVVQGGKGACVQRNTGMAALRDDSDIIAFFDDDYVPSRHCLEGIARAFAEDASLVGVSGQLLADGINSAGITYDDAQRMIADFDRDYTVPTLAYSDLWGTYGCNMAFRRSAIAGMTFDERLPLYAWQEDVDFSRRLLPRGRIARSNAFTGVHQGVKSGRNSGLKLGYSQIANPIYLIRKGTLPAGDAIKLMMRNVTANHVRAFRPEPWIDRLGRVAGNWRAVGDLVTGRLKPERILEM